MKGGKQTMFQGLHHCLLDDKGRLAFPAPLRASLERHGAPDRFVLTQALYEPCLVAMTEKDFEAQADKILALPPSNPAVVHFKRCVIAPATHTVIDKAGRVGIPKELREYAGLERDCVWAGVVEKIELWNKPRWDELRRAQSAEDLLRTREYLERHGL
jgi:MraZ protein